MRLGYACQNLTLGTVVRTCRLANATHERIDELARGNLADVRRMAEWNREHGIRFLRLSSDLVPFGGHPASGRWQRRLRPDFAATGGALRRAGQRVSLHPGPYVGLGSPDPAVARRTARELRSQADLLALLGYEGDVVIHAGGTYGDREAAARRFAARVRALPPRVRRRLRLENDDRSWNVREVLELARRVRLPVVYDRFHDRVNPTPGLPPGEALRACLATWGDLPPKVHYSEQDRKKRPGAHARRVHPARLVAFAREAGVDVMVEAKDKDRAVLPALRWAARHRPRRGGRTVTCTAPRGPSPPRSRPGGPPSTTCRDAR